MSNATLTRKSIDELKTYRAALSLVKQLGHNVKGLNNLQQTKDFLCSLIQEEREEIFKLDDQLDEAITNYGNIRRDLLSIAPQLTKLFHEETVQTEIIEPRKQDYWSDTLEHIQTELQVNYCSILVAGETNSGKSSFINLLVGEKLLPEDVISCTRIICYLHKSTEKKVVFKGTNYQPDSNTNSKNKAESYVNDIVPIGKDFSDEQKIMIGQLVRTNSSVGPIFDEAHFYWPIDFLEETVCLVDSPGLRERGDLDEITLQFMEKHCAAFVFILDGTNSGGLNLYSKELLKKCTEKLMKITSEDSKLRETEFRKAIFIINKWDKIEDEHADEMEQLKKKILHDLTNLWPNVDCNKQVYFTSVLRLFRWSQETKKSPRQLCQIRNHMKELVGQALQSIIQRGLYVFSRSLLDIESCLWQRIVANVAKHFSHEDQKESIKKSIESLHSIEKAAAVTSRELELQTNELILEKAACFCDFLKTSPTCRQLIVPKDLKLRHDIDLVTSMIKRLIGDKIQKEMENWNQIYAETNNKITALQDLQMKFEAVYLEKFLSIGEEMEEMKKVLSEEDVGYFLRRYDDDILQQYRVEIVSPFEKALLVTSCVFLIPIVAVGAVFAVPFLGYSALQDHREEQKMLKEISKEPDAYIQEKFELYIRNLNSENVKECFFAQIEAQYKEKVDGLKNYVANIIQSRRLELIRLNKEDRNIDELNAKYRPILKECARLLRLIDLIKFYYLTDIAYERNEIINIDEQLDLISESVYTKCFVEKKDKIRHGNRKIVTIFWIEKPLDDPPRPFLSLENWRNLFNLEGFLSIKYSVKMQESHSFMHILQHECSNDNASVTTLRNYLTTHPNLVPSCVFDNEEDRKKALENFLTIAQQLAIALYNLSSTTMTSADLRLETILIICDGQDLVVKLCDFTNEKRLDKLMDANDNARRNLPPEVYKGFGCYSKTDIFSLGLIMYQMYYFTCDLEWDSMKKYSLTSDGSADYRILLNFPDKSIPKCIGELISQCTRVFPGSRPNFKNVLDRFKEMTQETLNEII